MENSTARPGNYYPLDDVDRSDFHAPSAPVAEPKQPVHWPGPREKHRYLRGNLDRGVLGWQLSALLGPRSTTVSCAPPRDGHEGAEGGEAGPAGHGFIQGIPLSTKLGSLVFFTFHTAVWFGYCLFDVVDGAGVHWASVRANALKLVLTALSVPLYAMLWHWAYFSLRHAGLYETCREWDRVSAAASGDQTDSNGSPPPRPGGQSDPPCSALIDSTHLSRLHLALPRFCRPNFRDIADSVPPEYFRVVSLALVALEAAAMLGVMAFYLSGDPADRQSGVRASVSVPQVLGVMAWAATGWIVAQITVVFWLICLCLLRIVLDYESAIDADVRELHGIALRSKRCAGEVVARMVARRHKVEMLVFEGSRRVQWITFILFAGFVVICLVLIKANSFRLEAGNVKGVIALLSWVTLMMSFFIFPMLVTIAGQNETLPNSSTRSLQANPPPGLPAAEQDALSTKLRMFHDIAEANPLQMKVVGLVASPGLLRNVLVVLASLWSMQA